MPSQSSPFSSHKILPVTGVGSYPPPTWLRRALEAREKGELNPEEFEETALDAVQIAIRDQELAGLDLVTDGEIGRIGNAPQPLWAAKETLGFLWGVLGGMEGVAFNPKAGGEGGFQITGPLSAPEGLGVVQEYERAYRLADRPIKSTLPGPFSLALALADADDPEALEKVLTELKPILRQEMEALGKSGATDVQLDEPSLGVLMGVNPQRWVDYFNDLVTGLPFRIHLHICFRNLTRNTRSVARTYKPILPYLNDLQVHLLHLEYSLNDMRELNLLDGIAYDKHLAIGVVDAHHAEVESPQLIAERIRAVLKHVDVKRLHLAPDCGLSSLTRPLAKAKLKALCAGAQIVRQELNRGRR